MDTFPKTISQKIYKEFINDYEGFFFNEKSTIETYKKDIIDFIKINFDSYSFERSKEYEGFIGFDTWDEFARYNEYKIDSSTYQEIYFLMTLMNMIKENNVCNMDKEYMTPFYSSGFCWSKENKFIIFNER